MTASFSSLVHEWRPSKKASYHRSQVTNRSNIEPQWQVMLTFRRLSVIKIDVTCYARIYFHHSYSLIQSKYKHLPLMAFFPVHFLFFTGLLSVAWGSAEKKSKRHQEQLPSYLSIRFMDSVASSLPSRSLGSLWLLVFLFTAFPCRGPAGIRIVISLWTILHLILTYFCHDHSPHDHSPHCHWYLPWLQSLKIIRNSFIFRIS